MPAGTWPPSASLISHLSGFYYTTPYDPGNGSRVLANAANWYLPLEIPTFRTYDRMAIEATVTGTTSSVRLGIYADRNGLPNALLLDAGLLAISAASALELAINKLLTPGLVWLCLVQQGAAANATVKATGGQAISPYVGGNGITGATQGNASGYVVNAGDAGALSDPANITLIGGGAGVPIVALRAA